MDRGAMMNPVFKFVLGELLKSPWVVKTINQNEKLHLAFNKLQINEAVNKSTSRPQAYTLWTPRPIGGPPQRKYPDGTDRPDDPVDYITWAGLFDRRFTGRHLPPAPQSYMDRLASVPLVDPTTREPGPKTVLGLYTRPANQFTPSDSASALLCFFAQWFTDSFLRKDPTDERLNTSNHEIDLCQIYGLDAETATRLRTGHGGKLKTRCDGRFPERLYDDKLDVKDEFKGLPYVQQLPGGKTLEDRVLGSLDPPAPARPVLDDRKRGLYATGLERGNSTILYTAISTIFIREHNRLCVELAKVHPDWDDNRLFEIARNINIVMGLNLTINEYINQLAQPKIKFHLDRTFAEKEHWYRANRIAIEFDLLYRWHSFVPDGLQLPDRLLTGNEHRDYRFNNALLEHYGAATLIAAASRQPAGQVGMHNNPSFLWPAELVAHTFSRTQRVRPYNEYRVFFGQAPVKSFKELTGEDQPQLADELTALYKDVDDVEFLVGLFAQKRTGPGVLPGLLNSMVAVDAFSQILTNPLLSQNVYGPDAFSEFGLQTIKDTTSFHMVVDRNKMDEAYPNPASFAYPPPNVPQAAA
jgi:prostaglandin-endoperoxide synthase 2